MLCKGCATEKGKLSKSHIIPRSFFEELRDDKTIALRQYTNSPGQFNKKIPIGVYDQTILCDECENRFLKIDNYAADLLLHNQELQNAFLLYPTKDLKLVEPASDLKFFFMTVLWRASISSMELYQHVKLEDSTEKYLRALIWNNQIGNQHEFPFLLERISPSEHEPFVHKLIMDPRQVKLGNLLFYKFVFGGYVVGIKACLNTIESSSALFERLTSPKIIIGNAGYFEDTKLAKTTLKVLNEAGD